MDLKEQLELAQQQFEEAYDRYLKSSIRPIPDERTALTEHNYERNVFTYVKTVQPYALNLRQAELAYKNSLRKEEEVS